MTNIGAIKVKDCKQGSEYLVFVADGMGSVEKISIGPDGISVNPNGGTKGDNNQKLFRIGDYLLMGTGRGDLIQRTALELSKGKFASAKELADKVLELTDAFGLSKNDFLNFIIGGRDDDGLFVYHVNTTGNFGHLDGTADYKKRSYLRGDSAFDGSGSRHVKDYLKGCTAAGKSLTADDIADGLVLAYEFGKKGATDSGVNDKLQYGIISDKGVSTIYHPDIRLVSHEAFHQYLGEMCGVELPVPGENTPKEEVEALFKKRNDLARILRNVYSALDSDLKDHSESRTQYTAFSEAFAHDNVTLDQLLFAKSERTDTNANVKAAALALVNKGLKNLLNYKNNFDQRQTEMEQRALKYG